MLDMVTKITIMLEQLKITKDMLNDDSIRPQQREKLEDQKRMLCEELRAIYFDLFKIISN